MAEVLQQRLHELLVQQMTRAMPVAVGIPNVGAILSEAGREHRIQLKVVA